VYFATVFEKIRCFICRIRVDTRNGLGDVYAKIAGRPEQAEVEAAINQAMKTDQLLRLIQIKELQTFMFPSDVIVDASMPAMIRTSGQMWNKDGKSQDTR
jgi:isocitrate dehydrogenase